MNSINSKEVGDNSPGLRPEEAQKLTTIRTSPTNQNEEAEYLKRELEDLRGDSPFEHKPDEEELLDEEDDDELALDFIT